MRNACCLNNSYINSFIRLPNQSIKNYIASLQNCYLKTFLTQAVQKRKVFAIYIISYADRLTESLTLERCYNALDENSNQSSIHASFIKLFIINDGISIDNKPLARTRSG